MKAVDDLTSPQDDKNTPEDSLREESPRGYEFGDYWLNPNAPSRKFRLFYKGQPCEISDLRFRLLCILVGNGGRVVSSNDLMSGVWPKNKIDDTNRHSYRDRLDHLIPEVRKMFDENAIPYNDEENGYRIALNIQETPLSKVSPDAFADYSFHDWLSSQELRKVKIFLAAGVGFSFLYILAYFLHHLFVYPMFDWIPASVGLSFIQFIVVVGALAASRAVFQQGGKKFPASKISDLALMKRSGYTSKEWPEVKAGAIISLDKYFRYWKLLLFAWCGLYLALTVLLLLKVHNLTNNLFGVLSIATTFFNNCNSMAIALCFVVLSYPSAPVKTDQNTTETNDTAVANQQTTLVRLTKTERAAGLAIILIAVIELSIVLIPKARVFTFLTPDNVIWAFDLVSGFAGGVTLALYIGRIQSRFLGPSNWLPFALYLYVVMQALFVAIKEYAGWAPVIIEAALVLKCFLYLYVAWLFKSGRLLFYLVRVKKLYETVNIEWQKFLFNLDT